MAKDDEIAYKLMQALVVWQKQGGPKSIPISDATKIAQKIKPGITESEIKSLVNISSALDLNYGEIVLNKDLTDLM